VTTRRPLLAGNWKMFKTQAESRDLALGLHRSVADVEGRDVAVFPPLTSLAVVLDALRDSSIGVGVQCGHSESRGAFTGAVSMGQIADTGATLVLCGHSERRHVFGEVNEMIGKQVVAALAAGLEPYLCVGETVEERERGDTWTIVERQLVTGLQAVSDADLAKVTIAYEPVWAIGTGLTATPEQAQEVHASIRRWLGDRAAGCESLRVLYGGSVKPSNAAGLMSQEDIDGALVGGASLDADIFSAIVRYDAEGD
jgi:triosephosphate isomerase (TIM)